ncbi:neuronal nitric oxidse synthase protein inhibitor [Ochromonadaceae sp. CCMP2298]|nr:neuronal nitric oxidse synthase protein inhibitor [Ochromonadaceae sp. CCMP2298]|mmetsp:Transcript_23250/g.51618  ORF Transcript_23250/g.51618 Transcript_23250/m.51618 type:complete len:100 (+) Transcript_23250:184-483(+)|eukprot:CAMPEP_0173273774 /NCGR_PEP_ID=MMETSP1143-20121109/2084_1 /TAXON_ID=483371 /ORGANISM="non described non described, Strain CCMP2298" /LENGTH=99 /DNA_ID=CAMNT_0014210537 /DNA_START=98 /DNA_END=397 /DNA_ORIENTATION=-
MADVAAPPKVSNRKVKVRNSNIPQETTTKIIANVDEAMDKFTLEKDVATHVKKKCDELLSGTWHCIVGRNFGCSITHDTKYVLFLQVGQMHVLVFKSLE